MDTLVAQAKFAVVKNDSRKDGYYVYFARWIRAEWDELPSTMTWRWMPLHTVWDMAMNRDQNLAIRLAEVIKALCLARPERRQTELDRGAHPQFSGGRGKELPRGGRGG